MTAETLTIAMPAKPGFYETERTMGGEPARLFWRKPSKSLRDSTYEVRLQALTVSSGFELWTMVTMGWGIAGPILHLSTQRVLLAQDLRDLVRSVGPVDGQTLAWSEEWLAAYESRAEQWRGAVERWHQKQSADTGTA